MSDDDAWLLLDEEECLKQNETHSTSQVEAKRMRWGDFDRKPDGWASVMRDFFNPIIATKGGQCRRL